MAKTVKKEEPKASPPEIKAKGLIQVVNAKEVPEARVRMSLTLLCSLIAAVVGATIFIVTRYDSITDSLEQSRIEMQQMKDDMGLVKNEMASVMEDIEEKHKELREELKEKKEFGIPTRAQSFYGKSLDTNHIKKQIDSLSNLLKSVN